jgi:hypothetical protein
VKQQPVAKIDDLKYHVSALVRYEKHKDVSVEPVLVSEIQCQTFITSGAPPEHCQMLSEMNILLLFLLSFSLASSKPSPTRPFTVAAFQSPYPPTASNSVTGMLMYASNGLFYASRVDNTSTGCGKLKGSKCPIGNETVIWVDREGKAFLVA